MWTAFAKHFILAQGGRGNAQARAPGESVAWGRAIFVGVRGWVKQEGKQTSFWSTIQ